MSQSRQARLSIIIPTLNEEKNLHACLSAIFRQDRPEVIICDGGSRDHTLAVASGFPTKTVHSQPGRARQMNAGARAASGDVLLFLHADTILPDNGCENVRSAIADGYPLGCFARKFDTESQWLNMTSRWADWRVRRWFLAFGDQAIFASRELFEKVSGFRNLRRFEDLDLAVRARQHSRWRVLTTPVISSARRFAGQPLRRIIKDALLTIFWLSGLIEQ